MILLIRSCFDLEDFPFEPLLKVFRYGFLNITFLAFDHALWFFAFATRLELHIISGFVLLKIRCSGNPSTSPRPWKCGDSKSAVINVTHGNPQLHHDQPGCHFLFCLSLTDSCQQSFVLLLLFVIVPNLGLFEIRLTQKKINIGLWTSGWSCWLPWATLLIAKSDSLCSEEFSGM